MIREAETIAMTVFLVAVHCTLAMGQLTAPAILTIDVENVVEYQGDISDPSKFATKPNVTPSAGVGAFSVNVVFGDILAVNGQPAKGIYAGRPVGITLSPTPRPGQGIADKAHSSLRSHTFEILKIDGTPIGTMICPLDWMGDSLPRRRLLIRSPREGITRFSAARERSSVRGGN